MTESVTLHAGGRSLTADLALPAGSGTHGALVLAHEWWGPNDDMRSIAERFAKEGFVALVPDLYFGERATDPTRAAELMGTMSTEVSMDVVRASVALLRAHPRVSGKVGIAGFCMGGAMSFAAATSVDGLACAVPFYGIPRADFFDPQKVRCPVQAHFAARDDWAKPDVAAAFARDVNARGGRMDLFVYDAGHAFMRAGDPAVHDPVSAALAWPRAVEFLHARLG